jgi:hypothetical protein
MSIDILSREGLAEGRRRRCQVPGCNGRESASRPPPKSTASAAYSDSRGNQKAEDGCAAAKPLRVFAPFAEPLRQATAGAPTHRVRQSIASSSSSAWFSPPGRPANPAWCAAPKSPASCGLFARQLHRWAASAASRLLVTTTRVRHWVAGCLAFCGPRSSCGEFRR